MKAWISRHHSEFWQTGVGLIVLAALVALVVAYSTPIKIAAGDHPIMALVIGGVLLSGMTLAAYANPSRYIFLVAIPLVCVRVIVWLLLTLKTLHHVDFYTTTISQSASQMPSLETEGLAKLSSLDRRQFKDARRKVNRSASRLRHHLDRHSFWSGILLALAFSATGISVLSMIAMKRRQTSS